MSNTASMPLSARAGMLFNELERQFPNDTNVKLLAIESQLRDKRDSLEAKVPTTEFLGYAIPIAELSRPHDASVLRIIRIRSRRSKRASRRWWERLAH